MTIPSYPLFVRKNKIVRLFFFVDISNWHICQQRLTKFPLLDKIYFFCVPYFRWFDKVDVPSILLTNSWRSWRILQTVDEVDKVDEVDEVDKVDKVDEVDEIDEINKIDFFGSYFKKKLMCLC